MSIVNRSRKPATLGALLDAKSVDLIVSADKNDSAAADLAKFAAEAKAQAEVDRKHYNAIQEALDILQAAGVPLDV